MRFVYLSSLASILLVIAPVVAHLLRRQRAAEKPFAPTALVAPTPFAAPHRNKIDDRFLLALRSLTIVVLSLLGATPLIHCSRLVLERKTGASYALAIVLDDSLSMRATTPSGRSRIEVARQAASTLISNAREGDMVGLVLAGSPARVALSPTPELKVAALSIEAVGPSDRATDLDGAIALARSSLRDLPHLDKRIVVLTDRADGRPNAPPIGTGGDQVIPIWVPQDGLQEPASDCAVLWASRRLASVTARIACSDGGAAQGRTLEIRAGKKVVLSASLPPFGEHSPSTNEMKLLLPSATEPVETAVITGAADSIVHDDVAPIADLESVLAVGVVSGRANASMVSRGPAVAEQAIEALEKGVAIRPLPAVPDTAEELAPYGALVIDDPPGLTPEMRRAIGAWLQKGGVCLLAAGPRAAAAPLGASLEPLLQSIPRWESTTLQGIDVAAGSVLGASSQGLASIHPRGRSLLAMGTTANDEVLVRWSDGVPWLVRHPMGKGVAYVISLPTDLSESDLALRPAFLALLNMVVDAALDRAGVMRIEVGASWSFESRNVEMVGDRSRAVVQEHDLGLRMTPAQAGRYDMRVEGVVERRYAEVPAREIDMRPRMVSEGAWAKQGESLAHTDVSPHVALVLLALLASEMILRSVRLLRERKPTGK